MRTILLMLGFVALTACASDETVAGFTGTDRTWRSADDPSLTLRFQFDLLILKMPDAPCNIDVLQLSTMTQSEVSGDILILSSDSGVSLEFQAVPE